MEDARRRWIDPGAKQTPPAGRRRIGNAISPRIKACVRRLRETENKPEQQIRAILPCRPVCRCDRMNRQSD